MRFWAVRGIDELVDQIGGQLSLNRGRVPGGPRLSFWLIQVYERCSPLAPEKAIPGRFR